MVRGYTRVYVCICTYIVQYIHIHERLQYRFQYVCMYISVFFSFSFVASSSLVDLSFTSRRPLSIPLSLSCSFYFLFCPLPSYSSRECSSFCVPRNSTLSHRPWRQIICNAYLNTGTAIHFVEHCARWSSDLKDARKAHYGITISFFPLTAMTLYELIVRPERFYQW